MRIHPSWFVWAAPFLVTVAACDNDDGGDSSTTSVEARLAAAYCDAIESCFNADNAENIMLMLARQASTAECRTFVTRAILAGVDFDERIAAGTYTIDEAKLDTCLDDIADNCNLDGSPSCIEAVDGKVTQGGVCKAHEDCDGDAYCLFTGCDGVCQPRVALGAECDSSVVCSSAAGPATCNFDTDTCVAVEYRSGVAESGVCGDFSEGDKVVVARCAAGLACTRASDEAENETCVKPIAAGGACTDDNSPCALGTVCLPDGPDAETGTCKAFPIANNVGDTCNEEFGETDAVFCNPVLFLGCLNGKCEKVGDGSVGARCFGNQDLGGHCDAGNYCDEATNTCAAKKADGASCEFSSECTSDVCSFDGNGDGTCDAAVCD